MTNSSSCCSNSSSIATRRLAEAAGAALCILKYTRRFAPRAAYAARYARSGRKNSLKREKKSPCLIVSPNWRLENAKSPAAMLQENNPQTRHAWVYRVCTLYLVVYVIYLECICLEACDYEYRAFVGRMTNRHTDWVWLVLAACRWVEQTR